MEAIAVINQKGGVAKTTTAHAIAAGLKQEGYKVLMVDLDGQQSLTTVTGQRRADILRLRSLHARQRQRRQ